MTDAPERIWAMSGMDGKWSDAHASNQQPKVNDITAPFIFEYTRTDIAQAQIAALTIITNLMPEVLASLKQTKQDISLVADLEKAVAALKPKA
jgi:hypothetical protein